MGKPAEGRHDGLVSIIKKRLEERNIYDKIIDHEEYRTNNACGEIDLYAIKGHYALIFEMKSSWKGVKKAIHQLKRAEENCFKDYANVYKFVIHYNSNKNNDYSITWMI